MEQNSISLNINRDKSTIVNKPEISPMRDH
jgi:hypothetical protein